MNYNPSPYHKKTIWPNVYVDPGAVAFVVAMVYVDQGTQVVAAVHGI